MNYYEILEVSPNASAAVIRAAYKSLMQRCHPDKNPDDAALAERASLVVQAYEVLSDAERRSAYDRALKEQDERRRSRARGGYARPVAAGKAGKENRYFWLLCLILAAVIASGWWVNSQLKARLPAEAERKDSRPALPSRPAASPERLAAPAFRDEPAKDAASADGDARLIPALVTRLSVELRHPDRPLEPSGRVLSIPVVDVRVGTRDADLAAKHLRNTADLIRQRLQERLPEARFDELTRPGGEHYLARTILAVVGDATGTGKSAAAAPGEPESPERYGVVEVLLPELYSVR